jgi:polyferredoxin
MVIVVITITNDDVTNDDVETRERIRKRFREIDEQEKKRELASSVWVWVLFFGFLITFTGVFMMLLFLGIIPLTIEIIISTAVIIFGTFMMAVAGFIKGSPRMIMEEM